jgi:hypothetical protein
LGLPGFAASDATTIRRAPATESIVSAESKLLA